MDFGIRLLWFLIATAITNIIFRWSRWYTVRMGPGAAFSASEPKLVLAMFLANCAYIMLLIILAHWRVWRRFSLGSDRRHKKLTIKQWLKQWSIAKKRENEIPFEFQKCFFSLFSSCFPSQICRPLFSPSGSWSFPSDQPFFFLMWNI